MISNGMADGGKGRLMKKALVTGATGFLGGQLARYLHRLGWEVTATGRNEQAGQRLMTDGIRFVAADLRDRELILGACCGQEIVFHCGALSSPWGKYSDFYSSNVIGVQHVAEGCKRSAVRRLVHVSTPSVYFDYKPRYLIKETDPLPARSANHYAATKRIAEQWLEQRWREDQLPVIMLRPRAIFGPEEQALLPRLLRASERSGVPLLNGGEAEIDLTCVDNLLQAMLLCCESADATLGQTYNISNGEALPFRELVSRLFGLLELPLRTRHIPYRAAYGVAAMLEAAYRLLPLQGEPSLTRYTVSSIAVPHTLDIGKAQRELGYMPTVTVEQGLHQFAQWWTDEPIVRERSLNR